MSEKDLLAEEERAHMQTIAERDDAEDALGDAYVFVTGRAAEWSNLFGYEEATNEIAEAVKAYQDRLEAAKATMREARRLICDGAEIRARKLLAKALDEWETS